MAKNILICDDAAFMRMMIKMDIYWIQGGIQNLMQMEILKCRLLKMAIGTVQYILENVGKKMI